MIIVRTKKSDNRTFDIPGVGSAGGNAKGGIAAHKNPAWLDAEGEVNKATVSAWAKPRGYIVEEFEGTEDDLNVSSGRAPRRGAILTGAIPGASSDESKVTTSKPEPIADKAEVVESPVETPKQSSGKKTVRN